MSASYRRGDAPGPVRRQRPRRRFGDLRARSFGRALPSSCRVRGSGRVLDTTGAWEGAVEITVLHIAHPSLDERAEHVRHAREHTPLDSHTGWRPAADRPDPVALLHGQNRTRDPDLVPVRHGRMMASPFTFYRGAAAVMAADLENTPTAGLDAQLCGDAHLSNFGAFASPERRLVFDLNDFDETLPGPFEWDVKRLAASMLVAARDNGIGAKAQDRAVLDTVGEYRTAMRSFAAMGNLEVWYARLEIEELYEQIAAQTTLKHAGRAGRQLAKARTRDSMSALAKLTHVVDGEVRIVDQSPLIVPFSRLAADGATATFDELHALLRAYRRTLQPDRRWLLEQFELVDLAHKVVGVGSVGARAWIVLLRGRDGGDPLFLQIKEAGPSVLEPFLGASGFRNHGARVVGGQRRMQAASDIFLGWLHVKAGIDGQARDFYVRQLKDWKGSAEIERMPGKGLALYGRLCGWTLARAHARSGDR